MVVSKFRKALHSAIISTFAQYSAVSRFLLGFFTITKIIIMECNNIIVCSKF